MNVLVDATPLLLRSAGVKNYLWHWIRSMRAQAGFHAIGTFPWIHDIGALHHDASVLDPASTAWRLGLVGFLNLAGNPVMNAVTGRCDIFHASNMVRNPPARGKLTATIHDMTAAIMPQFHTRASVRADRYYADRILRRADAIIAVSESSKADAVHILRLAPERVTVIHSGVDGRFFDAKPAPSPKPYVLFLSTIEPRKNVDVLLDAWERLVSDIRGSHDLILAGPVGWRSDATMARIRAIPVGVQHIGYVNEDDLPGLVAGATAFVYPSLYEGFGFPPLQAMAAGVPTITSNVSSLPEIAGEAALLIDPHSSGELASAISHVLTSPSLRSEMAAKSRLQAARFSWERCARESIQFFEGVLQ